MAAAVHSRLAPILVAFAFGTLVPLAIFGAARLVAPPVASPRPTVEPRERVAYEYGARERTETVDRVMEDDGVSGAPPPAPVTAPMPSDELAAPALLETSASLSLTSTEASQPVPPPAPPLTPPAAPVPRLPAVPCGKVTCAPGDVCCSAACGICVGPNEACTSTQQYCGMWSYPYSEMCGRNTCNIGEVCCNRSCGTCAQPGVECSQTQCDDGPTYPYSQACGLTTTCNVGSVCCDARCGLCAPMDECAKHHC
jgi:hypothetical protein